MFGFFVVCFLKKSLVLAWAPFIWSKNRVNTEIFCRVFSNLYSSLQCHMILQKSLLDVGMVLKYHLLLLYLMLKSLWFF